MYRDKFAIALILALLATANPTSVSAKQNTARKPPRQYYCAVNPSTGVPYETTTSFEANKYLRQPLVREGGDDNTPGYQWIWTWTAPGPVYAVDGHPLTPGWMQIDFCTPDGNNAKCQGWVNTAGRFVAVKVRWKEKCNHETFVKEMQANEIPLSWRTEKK